MKHLALCLAISAAVLTGCKDEQKPAESTSTPAQSESAPAPAASDMKNALPVGEYKGVLPCASCEGIDTTIVLKDDGSYTLTTLYLGEPDAKPETLSGIFRLSDDKAFIHLDETGFNYVYFIDGDVLEMRDADGTSGDRSPEMIAAYRLQKQ